MSPKELVVRTVKKFIAKDTLKLGAALAYYTVFSLAPLLLLALAIAGAVFGEKAARGRLAEDIQSAVGPTVADAIEETLASARSAGANSTATFIGLIALLFGAGGVFGQLQDALNVIWEVPTKTGGGLWGWVKTRFLSFGMVLGSGFLLLVSLIASTAVTAFGKSMLPSEAFAAQAINQVLSFATVTVLFALIFKILPDCSVEWKNVWVGAAVTAALFSLGKYLLGLYLAKGSVGSPYGAAGSLAVILVWVYYASQILLLGAQFTQVYSELRFEAGDGPPPCGQASRQGAR